MAENQAPHVEVQSVHIVRIKGTSISTDGTMAMVEFERPDKTAFAITFPLSLTVPMVAMTSDLATAARRRDLRPGDTPLRYPNEVSVGHTDSVRGYVAMMFDPGDPAASTYMLKDGLALDIANGIIGDVMGRATPEERARLQSGLSLKRGVSRLILPHQR